MLAGGLLDGLVVFKTLEEYAFHAFGFHRVRLVIAADKH